MRLNQFESLFDENKSTILEEDISLINFYFELCGLNIPSHILKTGDNTYLMSDEMTLNDD